jgi:hypothetical protein
MTVMRRDHPAIAAEARLAQLVLGILTELFEGLAVESSSRSEGMAFVTLLFPPKRGSRMLSKSLTSSNELSARNAPIQIASQHLENKMKNYYADDEMMRTVNSKEI